MEMTSLQRMLAAIRGEPFDKFPVINVSPSWSMMPHWPAMIGLNFLHETLGSDEQRMCFCEALLEQLGLDWLPVHAGPSADRRGRYLIGDEAGVPVLVDTENRTKTRYRELPKDLPPDEPLFDSAAEVESMLPVPTAEEQLASGAWDFTRKLVDRYGDSVYLWMGGVAPFPSCFYLLGYERLFDAMRHQPDLLFALMERQAEVLHQQARLARLLGLHGMDVMEFFCSADLISEKDFSRFAFPYEQRAIHAVKEEGLYASMNLMGWIEPRLPYLARLELNCLQIESSLKGYENSLVTVRKTLGEEVCLFGNSHAVWVIEQGDEPTWHQAALEQAKAIGRQRRYAIGAGTPITWATGPARFKRFAEYTRQVLAEASAL
jgi:uroporphyrinogen-III decarboxylase